MKWIPLLVLVALAAVVLPPPVPTNAAPPMIAFFGDSLTQGLHASSPDLSYRGIILQRLAASPDAGAAVTVIQHPLGLLDDAETRLPQVVAARPSLVFLELGHHELWGDPAELDRFQERYTVILDQLLATGADVVPSTLAWLGYLPDSHEYQAALRINTTIRRLAAERGLVVADLWSRTDLRPELISTPNDASFVAPYHGDYLHPNDAGHRALADAFWLAYRTLRTRPFFQRPGPL